MEVSRYGNSQQRIGSPHTDENNLSSRTSGLQRESKSQGESPLRSRIRKRRTWIAACMQVSTPVHSRTTSNPSVSSVPNLSPMASAVAFAASSPAAGVSGLGVRGSTWPSVAKPSLTAKLTRSSLLRTKRTIVSLNRSERGNGDAHVDDDELGRAVRGRHGAGQKTYGSGSENEDAVTGTDSGASGSMKNDREGLNERRLLVGASIRKLVEERDGVVDAGLEGTILVGVDLRRGSEAHW